RIVDDEQIAGAQERRQIEEAPMIVGSGSTIADEQAHFVASDAAALRRCRRFQQSRRFAERCAHTALSSASRTRSNGWRIAAIACKSARAESPGSRSSLGSASGIASR